MKRNIKKMALAAMLAGMLGSLTGCFIQPRPDARSAANQRRDGAVRHGAGASDEHADPRAAEHAKPHAGHVAIQRPEHVGGLVERQSADNHAQNGGDCRAGRAKLADLHTGLQRGLSRAARRFDGQRRQRFAGAADRAGLLHRNDRRRNTPPARRAPLRSSKAETVSRRTALRAARRRTSSIPRRRSPRQISASTTESGYTLLKEGASGLEVRKLQGRLAELGYYAGGVDGIYGSTTTSAVKAFQRANGLSGDGQAGTQTQTKLYSANAKYATSPVTTANPDQTRTLSVGMTGNDVYALQERLIELNYLSGVADGVFGTETQNALIAFQNRNGLTADGTAGASTLKKLSGSCKAATATAAPSSNGTLHEGDSGEDVYNLQARLFELGYYNGRIDGRYSSETTAAVKAFQKANGLSADGIAGQGTLNKLNSGNAVVSDGTTDDVTGDETGDEPTATYQPTTAYTVLRRGDKSDQVQVMQRYLATLGYLNSTPDGQIWLGHGTRGEAFSGGERPERGRHCGKRHALHPVRRRSGELQRILRLIRKRCERRHDDRRADACAGYDDGHPVGERGRQRAPIPAAAGGAGLSGQQIRHGQIQPEDRGGDKGFPDDERPQGGRRGGAAVPQTDLFRATRWTQTACASATSWAAHRIP